MSFETRILLTSDIHIGAKGPVPPRIRLNSFKRIASLASSHDILIISGDLFDSPSPFHDDIDIVYNELAELHEKGITTLFTPGRNDIMPEGKVDERIAELPFSRIFGPESFEQPYIYQKNGEEIAFYGMPWLNPGSELKPAEMSKDSFNIGIFYAAFDERNGLHNDEKISRIDRQYLKKSGIDFYALGSNHFFKMFKIGSRIIGAYPGSPEAVNIDETGNRFVISFRVKERELHQIKRLTVNSAVIIAEEIQCQEKNAEGNILKILERNSSPRNILNLILTGDRDFNIDDKHILPYVGSYLGIHLDDQSTPTVMNYIENHKSEFSLRGEFFSIISSKIKQETDNETISAAKEILEPMIHNDPDRLEGLLCSS